MIPLFIDFPYLEPMVEMFRLQELRFSSYPQEPQLHESDYIVICHVKNHFHIYFAYTTKRKKQRQKAPKPQENQQQPFYHKLSVNENKVVRNSKSDFPQFHREKFIYKGTITSGKVIFIL
jgi:hypothetical protein